MLSLYALDEAARKEAAEWLDEIKASTQKQPLSQLFSMFKRESTVRFQNQTTCSKPHMTVTAVHLHTVHSKLGTLRQSARQLKVVQNSKGN